jgi:crotonobetainyl-CoA:carnitine CoA-transferase CaiB-like acyl-CoA transferase
MSVIGRRPDEGAAVPGVFEGLFVLDLSWGIAGPITTMMLADGGAAVTRIESPNGDPFAAQTGYRVWNRGKRSVALDLRVAEDLETFRRVAASADVVVEAFSPSTMGRLGLSHDELAAVNPRLITCSISGYGSHRRHRDRPGYDGLVAARTGLLYDQRGRRGTAMEYIAGRPGPLPEFDAPEGLQRGAARPGPIFPRTPWPSIGAAYLASLGVAAALRAREVTGLGQHVQTSLLEGALAAVCLNWQRVENPDAPLYWMWPTDSRSIEGLFECADGRWVHHWTVRPRWILAAAEGDELVPTPAEEEYRDDPDRISMEPDGMLTGNFLYPMLVEAFKKFPSDAWVAAGEAAGMGVALVRSPAEALGDPSFLADGCVVEVDDPEVGPIRHLGPVLEFSATPARVQGPAPHPGEHTHQVDTEWQSSTDDGASAGPAEASPLGHPLEGIRVLDLGLGVAGPFAGRMLADLGADVIKVHALHDTYWAGTHMGLGTNRGKRSISLNLKDPRGREVLERLLATADVFTTNWRPGAAARLGLDYDSLRERYPRLIHCNTRGYERGPRSDLPGTDQSSAALTGAEWEDGAHDAGNPPLWSRSSMGDTGNALLAAIAITAALYHRERTGAGQAVGTSIVNAGLLATSYAWIHGDGTPADWGHVDGNQFGLGGFYRLYECADATWLFLAAPEPDQRKRLADVLGEPGLATDPEADAADLMMGRFREQPASAWCSALDAAGVPVERVNESFCRELFDDPEAHGLGLVAETWAEAVGRFEDPGLLVHHSENPGIIQRGPCMCGEHTREILREIGYEDAEIDLMGDERAVLDVPVTRS